jgi:hypothetical protein
MSLHLIPVFLFRSEAGQAEVEMLGQFLTEINICSAERGSRDQQDRRMPPTPLHGADRALTSLFIAYAVAPAAPGTCGTRC